MPTLPCIRPEPVTITYVEELPIGRDDGPSLVRWTSSMMVIRRHIIHAVCCTTDGARWQARMKDESRAFSLFIAVLVHYLSMLPGISY